MNPIRAVGVGEEGFVTFAKELRRFGVVDRPELISLIAFHGAVMRAPLPRLDEEALEALADELGAEVTGGGD